MKETDYEKESALQEWEGVELMTVVEWCVSGAKDLRCIGREFHKLGDLLVESSISGERSCRMIDRQT